MHEFKIYTFRAKKDYTTAWFLNTVVLTILVIILKFPSKYQCAYMLLFLFQLNVYVRYLPTLKIHFFFDLFTLWSY